MTQSDHHSIATIKEAFGPEIDPFLHISLKHRYMYVQTPKVASTTLKRALVTLEIKNTRLRLGDIGLHPDLLNSVHVKPYQLSDDLLSEVLFSDGYFRFCFCRNPFARILSAYLDKIQRLDKPEGALFRRHAGLDAEADVTFAKFLDVLSASRNHKHKWDPHWRPQFNLLRPDILRYGLIGRIETFDADYAGVRSCLDGKIDAYEDISPHKTGASDKLKDYFTPALTDIVSQVFADDFAHFGYEKTIE